MPTTETQKELDDVLHYSERVGTKTPENNPLKRAKDMIFQPAATWPAIAEEEGGLKEAFIPYTIMIGLVPMLIGALLSATLFGALLMLMGSNSLGLSGALFHSVTAYIYGMFGILVLGKILELCAPSFGLKPSWVLSCRVLVYASTPSLLVGTVSWIPFLGWFLSLVAFIRSALLAYRGAKIVLKRELSISSGLKSPQGGAAEIQTEEKREPELVKI